MNNKKKQYILCKKIISCILITGLAVSLTACGKKEFGNHEKGVANSDMSQTEFSIMGGQSALSPGYTDNVVMNGLQEEAGIHIDWTTMSESLAEQVNIRIAGGGAAGCLSGRGFQ